MFINFVRIPDSRRSSRAPRSCSNHRSAFSKHVAEDCRPGPNDYDDPTREAKYPPDFLSKRLLFAQKRKVQLDYAIATSPLAARERFDPALYDRFGIDFTESREKPRYVLRPRQEMNPSQVRSALPFYGIPFVFDPPLGPPLSRTERVQTRDVYLGAGIRNIGQPGLPVPYGMATLGCFVRLKPTQERALLTTASALGGPGMVKVRDRIVLSGRINPAEDDVIASVARLHLPIASSPRSSLAAGNIRLNEFDAAVAVLAPGVLIQSGVGPTGIDRELRAPMQGEIEEIGTEVLKFGWASGITSGHIEQVGTTVNVQVSGEQYWYEKLFAITARENYIFSKAGDAGAVVFRTDGVVLGLIIAASPEVTLACPIQPVLAALGCELLFGL